MREFSEMGAIDANGVITFVGGMYVGCRVRVGPGTWETGACKNVAVNAWPIGADLYVWVCDEHLEEMRRHGHTETAGQSS